MKKKRFSPESYRESPWLASKALIHAARAYRRALPGGGDNEAAAAARDEHLPECIWMRGNYVEAILSTKLGKYNFSRSRGII